MTDPLGNDTERSLGGPDDAGTIIPSSSAVSVSTYTGCSPHDTATSICSGSGTLLRAESYVMTFFGGGGAGGEAESATAVQEMLEPSTITTKVPTSSGTVLESKVVKTLAPKFGSCTVVNYPDASGYGSGSSSSNTYVISPCSSTNQVASEADYDFGVGAPGHLIKTTNTTYAWQNSGSSPNYLSANLIDLPSSVVVTAGGEDAVPSGTRMAETDYGYDEAPSPSGAIGNPTSVTRWLNSGTSPKVSTAYNTQGMPTSQTDARNNVTTITYDSTGAFPKTVTYPSTSPTSGSALVAHTEGFIYDATTGRITSQTDQNANTTTYSYIDPATGSADPLNRIHKIGYPQTLDGTSGAPGTSASGYVQYTYDDAPGSLAVTQQALKTSAGQVLTKSEALDGLGEVIHATDPTGAVVDTNYDALGRVHTVSNAHFTSSSPTDGTITYAYDAIGRTIQRTNPDGSTHLFAYSGNVVTETDESLNAWSRTLDGLGRLTKVAEPLSLTSLYTYDSLNNLKSVIQQGNGSTDTAKVRTFTYDSLSRLTLSHNPETGFICYGSTGNLTPTASNCAEGYDPNGNLLYKTDARGITTTYSYDALNRLTAKHYSDGTPAVGFGYDGNSESGVPLSSDGITSANAIGRLSLTTNVVDAGSAYSYDAMGRIVLQTSYLPGKPGWNTLLPATYDLAGNRTSLTYPDGRTVQQGFDGAGRMASVNYQSWNGTGVNQPYLTVNASGGYDAASHLIGATFGNGVAFTAAYDNRERVGNLAYGATSAPLWSKQYAWTANSNLQSQTDLITGIQRQFNYDNLNRLTAAQDIYSSLAVASGSNDNTGSTSSSGSGASETPGGSGAMPEWTNPDDSNLLTDIGESSSSWSLTNVAYTLNSASAPDGTTTATVLSSTGSSTASGYIDGYVASPADYANETMTGSVWLKTPGAQALSVYLYILGTGPSGFQCFGFKLVQVTSTWQQFQVTGANPDGLTSLEFQIGGSGTFLGGEQIQIWHPMFEDEGIAGTSVTNFLPYSQRLTAATWQPTSANIVDNAVAAPDGTMTASSLSGTSGTAGQVNNYVQNPAPFDGMAVTASVWLRVPTISQTVALGLMEVNPAGTLASINFQNVSVGTAWTRFQLEGSAESALSLLALQIGGNNTIGTTQPVYIWGAQIELASVAGPYISTDALPATQGTTLTNLLTYSQQPVSWSANATIAVSPNTVAAPDGSMTASRVTAQSADANFADGVPNAALYDGATVTGSIYLKLESGTPTINLYVYSINAAGTTQYFTSQTLTLNSVWQRFQITGTAPPSITALAIQIGGATSFRTGQVIDIWGAQIEIASHAGPYVATTGMPIITGSDPTNVLPNSQKLSGSNWTMDAGSVTTSTASAPDGTTTAAAFMATSGSVDSYAAVGVPNPSLYDAETVTASVFLRLNTATAQNLNLYLMNNGDQGIKIATTSTVTLTSSWQRFDLTATLQNGLTSLYLQVGGGGSLTGGESYQIWGVQLVVGSAPAPYIPTNVVTTVYATGQSGTLVPTGLNLSYSYDSFGNLLQNGSFQTSYTANNQMFGYAYDAAGNLLSDQISDVMTWDAESRISSVGGATYVYDAEGNRVEKQGSVVTDTVYFGGQPVARYAAGQWTDLIYGPTGLLAEVPGTQTGVPTYRVTDHLGTNVGSLLANGTFADPIDHTPFGQVFTGNTSDPYLFTGKERDAESGLDYFGARYYASNMGRWMSPDWSAKEEPVPYSKLDNPQTLNLYSYVVNNPLSQVDDDGHEIIYADGLKNSQLVRDTVTAILANPNTSSYLSGYVGPNAPNLTIQSGDLGPPTVTTLPNGQTLTTTVQGNTSPDIQTSTMTDNNGVKTSETTLTGATITIDNNTSKGDTPGVMIHESVHAGEAQANPAKFAADAKSEAGQPHDSRPQEQRANAVRAANEKQIKQQVKQIEKDRKKDQ